MLEDETTPVGKFFIRNNGQIPPDTTAADAWRLTIDGECSIDVKDRVLKLEQPSLRYLYMYHDCKSTDSIQARLPVAIDHLWCYAHACKRE